MMLIKLGMRARTAAALAVLSLFALGIEPTAQQIIDFTAGEVKVVNVTAKAGMATDYFSKSYDSGSVVLSNGAAKGEYELCIPELKMLTISHPQISTIPGNGT